MHDATVGLGLLGCGRMGSILARAIVRRVPGARLIAVADVDGAAARRLAEELGIDAVSASGAELADRLDVQGVVIAVSSAHHLEAVRAAAAAGRDIFCEKPLALTIADTAAAIDAAARASVRLQVGFMRRFDGAYAAELRAFVRAIARDESVAVDGEDGLAALWIALAADRSMREGRPIAVAEA